MENWWANAIWSLTPSVIIGVFFWFVVDYCYKFFAYFYFSYSLFKVQSWHPDLSFAAVTFQFNVYACSYNFPIIFAARVTLLQGYRLVPDR